jgi:hypothetical protein
VYFKTKLVFGLGMIRDVVITAERGKQAGREASGVAGGQARRKELGHI